MLNRLVVVLALSVLAAGCGVKAQSYIMVKDRVDQEQTGNSGCLTGQCAPASPEKTTRKVYVLEVTKPLSESADVKKVIHEESSSVSQHIDVPPSRNGSVTVTSNAFESSPMSGDEQEIQAQIPDEPVVEAQMYTVLKDDTLQKIAKKVYGSYSKWIKIYEANKDKIKDPNLVKPGTVLNLPASN